VGLISKTIPGFYNGVSQQAAPMRLPTQCEDQVNCYSDLVNGLTKRPNTEQLALVTSNASPGSMMHGMNISAEDQYILVITGNSTEPVEVFRLDTGVKCSIRYGVLNQETDRTNCYSYIFGGEDDTLYSTAHGLENGQQIDLDGELPAELSSDTPYYVVEAAANNFKVALTSGGSAIEFDAPDAQEDITWLLQWTPDDGVKGYFAELNSLEPNEVFKVITLADTTHILNTNITPRMTGETLPGEIAGKVQTITDLPTGAGIPAADSETPISPAKALSYTTQLAADEAGDWTTGLDDIESTGHVTFKIDWDTLTSNHSEGATRLEFQWVVADAGWAAPNIDYGWFFGNTMLTHSQYYRLPITAGTYDIRIRRVGSPDYVLTGGTGLGTSRDCNYQGCKVSAWSTGADIYEITGAADSSAQSYYLQHDGDVWLETLKPGLKNKIAAATMPHILQLTDTNEFTFSLATWGDRTVGDDDTSPLPSFIDEDVANITFFKDRFGMLSQENIILSQLKSTNYYNFFPTSSIDVLDDDPIDISATNGEIAPLRSSMVYDKDLVLFSDEKQFVLSSGDKPLTPTSAAITPSTNYAICNKCEPTGAGANVYFISPKLDYVSLREYMILPDSLVTDAADVTAHVPHYIPKGDLMVVKALNSFDCLFVWSDADPQSIYVYKYYWLGNEKPQSSWSKWTFDDNNIIGMTTTGGYLTIMVERESTEIGLERIYLEPEQSGNLDWRVHLDRRVTLTGVYDDGTDLTTWTAPYDIVSGWSEDVTLASTHFELVDEDTGLKIATPVTVTSATTITKDGDYSGTDYLFGKPYSSTWQPTPWHLRDDKDTVISEGRIQVRRLTLSYTDTGYFQVTVTPVDRDGLVHTFTPDTVGVAEVDTVTRATGKTGFPIMAQVKDTVIEVSSASYLPFQFIVGSWMGAYHPKAKAI